MATKRNDFILLELFDDISNKFLSHLSIEDNHRIVLSGRFGSGKTTFLKHFFETNKDKYEYFRLAPVNYSISQNEDIFQYIKYDILYELLKKPGITIDDTDITGPYLITKTEVESILKTLLSGLNLVGFDLEKVYDKLKSLKQLLEKRKEAVNEEVAFHNFLSSLEAKEGSLFENDIITRLIEKVLQRYNNTSGKEVVLIIDDIDRLDPEHIFRILNIFSAHFDEELYKRIGKMNKFSFHKLILVFDYENIKSLFAAKYGISADFNGYVDKFYSTEIFFFNNREGVKKVVHDILGKMILSTENRMYLSQFGRNEDDTLERILLESILIGRNSLRNLKKVIDVNIENSSTELNKVFYPRFRGTSTFTLQLLYYLFGTTDNILQLLNALKAYNIVFKIDSYLAQIIYIVLSKNFNPEFQNGEGNWNIVIEEIRYRFVLVRPNGTVEVRSVEYLSSPAAGYAEVHADAAYVILKYFFNRLRQKNIFN